MARLTPDDAKDVARRYALDLSANFHALNSEAVSRVLAAADERGYRKPSGANGSRARYFFYHLVRTARRTD